MARAGRKRKSGQRHPNGQLVRTPRIDRGTPELQLQRMARIGAVPVANRDIWLTQGAERALAGTMPTKRERKDGAQDGVPALRLIDTSQTFDPVGRAWASGLLDGFEIEADELRDTARRFAVLYWHKLPDAQGSPVSGLYRNMISGLVEELPPGINLEKAIEDADERDERQEHALNCMLSTLRRAGHTVKVATEQLALDPFADAGPSWLDWLIAAKAATRLAFQDAIERGDRPGGAPLRACDWHLYAPDSAPHMAQLRRAIDGLVRIQQRA